MKFISIQIIIITSLFYQFECIQNDTAQNDQVTSLPALNATVPFRHYAGYLKTLNDTSLFYWFFESQSQPETDPLVLWLNGGPGCSSLTSVLLESGPFQIQPNGTLRLNPHTWNSNASMLFLESPAGVGFSYKSNVSLDYNYATNDNETVLVNFEALRSFYRKFPQFTANNFYLSGESYAGVYLATLSTLILEHQYPANFKGIILGNPLLDQRYSFHALVEFAHKHGFLDSTNWSSILHHCNCPNGTIRYCPFTNSTIENLTTLLEQPPKCANLYTGIQVDLLGHERNLYNYKQKCSNRTATYVCKNQLDIAAEVWFNRVDVQVALGVVQTHSNSTIHWKDFNSEILFSYNVLDVSIQKEIEVLLKKNIKVLLYFGDLDLVCSYIHAQWFLDDLNVTAVNNGTTDWFYDNQIAATVQVYEEGLVYVQVKEAGHEVVRDKPAFSKHMFDRFVNASLFT